jgi:hypothetical protein
LSENALKLTYGNVEFQNFPEKDPRTPAPREGKGKEEEWERRGVGNEREEDEEAGREGVEQKGYMKGKERGETGGGEGERNSDPRCSRQIDAIVVRDLPIW